jgi:replication factor C subunit 1
MSEPQLKLISHPLVREADIMKKGGSVSFSGTVAHGALSSIQSIRGRVKVVVPRANSTLYVGETCNDGRPITESWKYKEAVRLGIPIVTLSENDSKDSHKEEKDERKKKEERIGWADKYRPSSLSEVIGHRTEIAQLRSWLQQWSSGMPEKRGIVITGPPGIGKTTVVHLLAKEAGYAVTEYNASDTRSVSALRGAFALGMKRLRREVIVMDEVDGLSERGGVVEVATIIKRSTVPIFCIANERGPKLKPLAAVCVEMRFSRPVRSSIAVGLERILQAEGQVVSRIDLEALCERNGNDIRSILHQLEFRQGAMISGETGANDKDASHRMEPFSVTQRLFANKKMPWSEASDLVFVDYHLIPLMVQEAYVHAGQDDMEAIADAAEDLSRGDIMTRKVYHTQDWGLIPHALAQPIMAVKRVPGRTPFQIFPQVLGKMSKQRKQVRQMSEVGRRVAGTSGAGGSVLRLDYAEPLRRVLGDRLQRDKAPFQETIRFMDGVGVTRDDWWDTLEETAFQPMTYPTQVKSAFTREWNKCHEEGDGIRRVVRRGKGTKGKGTSGKGGKVEKEQAQASQNGGKEEEGEEEGEVEEEEEEEEEEWEDF